MTLILLLEMCLRIWENQPVPKCFISSSLRSLRGPQEGRGVQKWGASMSSFAFFPPSPLFFPFPLPLSSVFPSFLLLFFLLLLLLLSRVSRVRLCATPLTAAHQAPPSLGFSRQEHWSACHFLLQCMKVKSESEVAQLCPTLRDPMDYNPPDSSVHGIFQARVLEWGAITFSRSADK